MDLISIFKKSVVSLRDVSFLCQPLLLGVSLNFFKGQIMEIIIIKLLIDLKLTNAK
jgi:hypothetical protein